MKEYIYRVDRDINGVNVFLLKGELVRCGDCRYSRYNYGNAEDREYNPNDIVCTYFDTDEMDASDYCSYGERRSDEGIHSADIR